jgi:ABC-type transport system involved in cytochrome c biogenesis permease component
LRWLLVKDLQILRRSPFLVALLVIYPVAIALMIGFALSSPPGKPRVAFYSGVPTGKGQISLGKQQVNVSNVASKLFQSIDPIKVNSEAKAVAKVRSGDALAALIIPADIVEQVQALVTTGVGHPTVKLVLNIRDPLERQFADSAIKSRLADVETSVSKQVLGVAVSDLGQVLNGGRINFLGRSLKMLGLRTSRSILQTTIAALPPRSPLRAGLQQVATFAGDAIEGLGFASPVLGSIGSPLTVQRTELSGKTTPSDAYAVAIAVIVSLMFVTLLLASGLLALEREEHAFGRLVRGLVTRTGLLTEKVVLAAGCAGAVTLLMTMGISAFVHVQWSRFALWIVALAFGGLAFAALGVAIGGVAREVRAASLLAFLMSLPIAFVALIPANAVSGTLKNVLDFIAALFPFKPALQAMNNALNGSSPGILGPLLHLAILALVFGALARLALRRFA